MSCSGKSLSRQPSFDIEASVQKTETWHRNKKFTVYKVGVVSAYECWFVFRRYNEFYKLHDILKKQVPNIQFKLPGKKLFGNNLDPLFVAQRREGLNLFVQQLMQDPQLLNIEAVRIFLQLDSHLPPPEETEDPGGVEKTADDNLNLGPSERLYTRPSDFEFLHVIGKGSFGKVLLARHRSDQVYYAVKVLSKRLILRQNEAEHIMSERNVLVKNLHHPFLVGLHFSFQTRDKLFFVLDYVNGGELFFHLQKERTFSEPRARFYAAEISSALGYLHSQGIVYRDLKPENLLLDSVGHVVLTDFGLSKEGLRATDTTSTFCGTPEYLAPEVIRKQAYDRSVDWWCLGAVLYEMLYGLPPFYSRNTTEMYDQILYEPLRLRVGPSEAAKKILMELLEKSAANRLGSGYGDFDDVQCHVFFRGINWSDLLARKIKPPFNPQIKGELDMQHIDPAFVRESLGSVSQSQTSNTLTASVRDVDEHFVGFSYSYAAPIDQS